jgi:hypothetical protein
MNIRTLTSCAAAGLLAASSLWAQPTPAPPQRGSVLILHATAHLGTGDVVANSGVGFRDGRIDYVGSAETVPRTYDRVTVSALPT